MKAPSFARRRVAEGTRPSSAVLRALRVVVEPDLDPDLSNFNAGELAEYRRGEARGEHALVGVRVEADVLIGGTEQTLSSTGVWGVENDEDEYMDEIIAQEWNVLRGVLKTVGVPTAELPLEADREWIEWRT
jgi:hypothetical protein